MQYDPAGRVLKITKKINDGPAVTIEEDEYDMLGQLKTKKLGLKKDDEGNYTTTPLETLDYTYNIRGWLKGINKDYANNTGETDRWFGMELNYDWGFTNNQFNGNIAGTKWRSKGDGEQRAYGFGYDQVNRLQYGDFSQKDGSGYADNGNINFDMQIGELSGDEWLNTYDANGNILKMKQWGIKGANSQVIDDLTYNYAGTGYRNKLSSVNDINTTDNKLGDFTDKNTSDDDYSYDANGNLTVDKNKKITSIQYNHLNLPRRVTMAGIGTGSGSGDIYYVYDAAGNKLQKYVNDNSTSTASTTTTQYISGFIYENKNTNTFTLQFFGHEDGRVRYIAATDTKPEQWVFDYFIKDHLGNVRTVLTDEQQQDIYPAATLEGDINSETSAVYAERGYYDIDGSKIAGKEDATGITDYENNNGNPPANPNPNSNVTANSEKLYRLQATTQGGVAGLGMTLKVMSGDRIDVLGKSYYFQQNSGGLPANYNVPVLSLLNSLLGSPASAAFDKAAASELNNLPEITDPLNSYLSNPDRNNNGTGTTPKAYINYILFDEQFKYVSGGFSRAGEANVVKNHFEDEALQNIAVTKNGYLYVYVSNESPVAVFFDNLQVVHTRGPLLEENHYYPFGLTMAGISSKALKTNYVENKKNKFQNQEFNDDLGVDIYEFKYRMDDPQTGRFWQVDPLSEKYAYNSTYAFSENKVTGHVELEGLEAVSLWSMTGIRTSSDPKEFVKNVGKEALKPQNWISAVNSVTQIAAPLILTTIMTGGTGDGVVLSSEVNALRASTATPAGTVETIPFFNGKANILPEVKPAPLVVNEETITAALEGSTMKTTQPAVSIPAVEKYVRMLENGSDAPAITVAENNVIIDGNHRYVAGRVFGKEPATKPGTISPSSVPLIKPIQNLMFDPLTWGNK